MSAMSVTGDDQIPTTSRRAGFQCRLLGPVILTVIRQRSTIRAGENVFENKNKISVASLPAALHSLITQQLNSVVYHSKGANLCVNFWETRTFVPVTIRQPIPSFLRQPYSASFLNRKRSLTQVRRRSRPSYGLFHHHCL